MILRWENGRAEIDMLLSENKLSRVEPNKVWALRLIDIAEEQIVAADLILEVSPLTAFQTYYDALHKMVDALLVNQGLRGTAAGGHVVLQRTIAAQLDPPLGELVKDFGWMRQLRNAGDYPVPEKALANLLDAKEAAEVAKGLLDKIRQLVDQMPVY